jgi:hypothetical protein
MKLAPSPSSSANPARAMSTSTLHERLLTIYGGRRQHMTASRIIELGTGYSRPSQALENFRVGCVQQVAVSANGMFCGCPLGARIRTLTTLGFCGEKNAPTLSPMKFVGVVAKIPATTEHGPRGRPKPTV